MKVTKKFEAKKKKIKSKKPSYRSLVAHNKLIWFVCMSGDDLYRLQLIEKILQF